MTYGSAHRKTKLFQKLNNFHRNLDQIKKLNLIT